MVSKKLRRAAIGVVLTAAGLTGVVGFLHTSMGRPWLAKVGGCPITKATAAEVEEARRMGVRATRGTKPAPERPAIGFVLEGATTDDVHAWAAKNDLSCTDKREGMLIACKAVPLSALGDRPAESGKASEVNFAFRPVDKKLVNLTVVSFNLPSEVAAARMKGTADRLERTLGAPDTAAGEIAASNFARGGYATATVQYRFSDFMAEVTATSFGERGVALREHYVSAND